MNVNANEKEIEYLAIDESSPSIQTHLGIIQNVIQRMANNSASCKAWCVTIVAAILVVVTDKGKANLAWLAIFPTVLFAVLDVYYLALEKGFINSYNAFIRKLHNKKLTADDMYSLAPTGTQWDLNVFALKSFSVWGFYAPLLLLAAATMFLIS